MSSAVDTPRTTWRQACARRLARHHLAAPGNAAPADIAGAICGAHAQIMSAAELSIGLRIDSTTRDEVRAALWTERTLVKTYGPRGTVHLLPTRDLPLWTAALSAIPPAASSLPEPARMTAEQTDQVVAAVATALTDAELTVDELTEVVVAATGSWAGDLVVPAFQGMWPRWVPAVPLAANRGALCFGPNRGRKSTYTSPQRWLPGFTPLDPDTASTELLRRYLRAYGPATPQHFARWFGAPQGWVNGLFTSMAGELEEVGLGDTPAWMVAGDTEMPVDTPSGVRLLPYFDAYTVGCHPRELLFPGRAAERALNRGQAGNFPVLLIDGTVAGVWHQKRSGRRLQVTVEPLQDLSGVRRRALDEQVARIGDFGGDKVELTIGTVTTGPHA